jgi:hypothetical protein
MALGRLELGEVELTSYDDPVLGAEVKIKFRHATKGELFGTVAEAGLALDEKGELVKGADGGFSMLAKNEEADILLAHLCILDSDPIVAADIYRPALVAIGNYIRESGSLGEEEGKP